MTIITYISVVLWARQAESPTAELNFRDSQTSYTQHAFLVSEPKHFTYLIINNVSS